VPVTFSITAVPSVSATTRRLCSLFMSGSRGGVIEGSTLNFILGQARAMGVAERPLVIRV